MYLEKDLESEGIEKRRKNLRTGAVIAIAILMVNCVVQFINIYTLKLTLENPLIPQSAFWEIGKWFALRGGISAIVIIGSFFMLSRRKYTAIIVLVLVTLTVLNYVPWW